MDFALTYSGPGRLPRNNSHLQTIPQPIKDGNWKTNTLAFSFMSGIILRHVPCHLSGIPTVTRVLPTLIICSLGTPYSILLFQIIFSLTYLPNITVCSSPGSRPYSGRTQPETHTYYILHQRSIDSWPLYLSQNCFIFKIYICTHSAF